MSQFINPTPSEEKASANSNVRARNAARLTITIFGATLSLVMLYIYLAWQMKAWQMYLVTGILGLFAVLAYIALRTIRKGRSDAGSWMVIIGMLVVFPATTLLVSDVSLIFGLALTILSAVVANQTLPAKDFPRAMIAGVIVGVLTAIIDLFPLEYRLFLPIARTIVPALTGVIVLIAGYFIARRAWRGNIRLKIITAFTAVSVVSLGILGTSSFLSFRNQIRENFRQRLINMVSIAAIQQDGDLHAKIQNPGDEDTDAYKKIQAVNSLIVASEPDIDSMYTMRLNRQGQIVFVVDAAQPGDDDLAAVGEIYEEPTPLMFESFSNLGQAMVEEEFYTDQWGTFLSAYAPFYTEGGRREGVIGIDIEVSTIVEQEQIILQRILGAAAGTILLVGLLGFLLGNIFAQPITNLSLTAQKFADGDLNTRAEIESEDEIGNLAKVFNEMSVRLQDTFAGLERRVAERTADVELARLLSERRAEELQSISEISRAISTEQKLEVLLPLITRLVSERFDFYHVGIFFVDDTRRFTYLQATNSEGGQKMLARGHRLEVGKGLVGTVAKTGKPRIALDVGSDAAFFDNPDLPDTRSEMALPLSVRGQIIGVLDVQSTKAGAFSEGDANTLSILGDQVAIAIENARLFGQTQQAREEAESLYSQVLRQEWSSFNRQLSSIGYHQTPTGGKSIKSPVLTDDIKQTLESGQVVAFDGKGRGSTPSIAIPVKLRGHTLGVLNIKAPTKDRKWNQDEINLAQAISDRLALALDNARLLQESQRSAAKEAKIGEVSAKISASINMRSVLETAVEELGRALPGSDVVIQFNDES